MMAEVFREGSEPLADDYIDALLTRDSFWVFTAFNGSDVVGGLTAHTLPMTRSPSSEVFIYDVAVRPDHQRRGIGSRLVSELRQAANAAGIEEVFVPADDEDEDARSFYAAQAGEPSAVAMFTFGAPPE